MSDLIWLTQPNFGALIEAVAERIELLLDKQHGARIALAGGRTPRALLQRLRRCNNLSRLTLVPTDERWVDVNDAYSNEGMFRRELIATLPAEQQPKLVSLKTSAATPAEGADEAARRVDKAAPGDFDLVLLGMGTDGHVASLFPGAQLNGIADSCVPAVQPETGQARLSLSPLRLLRTRALALAINGTDKRNVLHAALADSIGDLPVAQLLRKAQARGLTPSVYWTADESMEIT